MGRLRRPMPRPGDEKPRPTPAVVVQAVDPLAWRTALRLAGGNHRRLKVLNDHTVLVCNNEVRR